MLAAASQRTRRIEFGTAVIPLGWENPLRLAEDLAPSTSSPAAGSTPGISVGPPMHYDEVKAALYPDTADVEDFTYERVERLLRLVRGEPASTFSGIEGIEVFSDRVQPHSPGLADRLWYGGGQPALGAPGRGARHEPADQQRRSTRRGAETSPRSRPARSGRSAPHHPAGDAARVSQGLVVIPTDTATAEQRAKYEAYVAARTPRTATPQGPARLLFARDIVGTSDEIAEQLYAHAAFREVDEVAFALPFTFEHEDYVQILTDMATKLGPALGWSGGSGGA